MVGSAGGNVAADHFRVAAEGSQSCFWRTKDDGGAVTRPPAYLDTLDKPGSYLDDHGLGF